MSDDRWRGRDRAVSRACLILDFDGTILDTEDSLYRSWAELWADHGHQLVRADWQHNIGTEDVFDPLVELESRLGRTVDAAAQERRRARRDEIQSAETVRPGVLAWLDQARLAGVPVGIASSSSFGWVDGQLGRLGLREYFSCVVCRDDHVPVKPAPTSYVVACRRLDADPGRSVAVEDSPHGVAAAVTAGLFTVAVPHALTSDLDLSAADLVVPSLHQTPLADVMARAAGRGAGMA